MKKLRKSLGFTQRDMAKMLDISRSCYSNYENGIREPGVSKGTEIKKILQTDDDGIFYNYKRYDKCL